MKSAQRVGLAMRHLFRRSLRLGAFPTFLIIGAQKAGTTSLFEHICQSPQVKAPLRKEVHYFDRLTLPSRDYYRAFFPSKQELSTTGAITGEATPFYLFHPGAAERIAAFGLRPRLIAILRCPRERAISHYLHERRKGRETLPLGRALALEDSRLRSTYDRVLDLNHLHALQRYSYLSRGRYSQQLQRFVDLFGGESLLVLSLDALRDDPMGTVTRCWDFLGVEHPPTPRFEVLNRGTKAVDVDCDPEIWFREFSESLRSLEKFLPEAALWRQRLSAT